MIKLIKHRKTHINGYYTFNDIDTKKFHLKQLFFLLVFILGLCIGAVAVRRGMGDTLEKLMSIYENYIDIKKNETLLTSFCNSFFKSTAILILIYSAGLSALGAPIIFFIPLVNGIGLGTVSAYMYSIFSLKGIGYCSLLLYPPKVITTVSMLTACSYSLVMSTKILKTLTNTDEEINYRQYNMKYLVLLSISVLSALIDVLLNSLFIKYFNFH